MCTFVRPTNDVSLVKDQKRSPQITHVSWGRLEVEGKAGSYKDAKLFPGGSREWNWRETRTEHVPGIQPADVQELLDHGANVVVLSRGMAECLQVSRETLDFLKEGQIEAHVLPTPQAAELYNRLAKERAGRRVVSHNLLTRRSTSPREEFPRCSISPMYCGAPRLPFPSHHALVCRYEFKLVLQF